MVIQVDTSSLVQQFGFTKDQVDSLLDFTAKEITARFASEWENEANSILKSSRQQYINSIVVVDEGFAKGAVMLVGEFPNMIESGAEPFDMKPGFLNGPNAKTGADGKKYNTIPFSFGTSSSLEENFSNIMPQQVYDVAKNKTVDRVSGISSPITKEELPKAFQEPVKKQVVIPKSKSFAEYQHKSSIYEGITKRQDARTKQNTYGSFRRVSENSDPLSWLFPGLQAREIADKTLQQFDIPSQASNVFDMWWSQNI